MWIVRSVDGKLCEFLTIPSFVFDWIDMKVLVSCVNQVHKVTKAPSNVVRSKSESCTAWERRLEGLYRSSSTNSGHFSGIKCESSCPVASKNNHLIGVQLDTCCRHRLYEIRIVDFKLLPLLHRYDSSIRSAVFVTLELVGRSCVQIVDQA